MTAEQWELVVKYLPIAYAKVNEAADQLRAKGRTVDEDQLQSDALDEVIDTVRKLTEGRLVNTGFAFLTRRLTRSHQRRQRDQREFAVNQDRFTRRYDESVEEYLDQLHHLPAEHRRLLLQVAYKRSDELLTDVLTPKEMSLWKRKVHKSLRLWAESQNLLGGPNR